MKTIQRNVHQNEKCSYQEVEWNNAQQPFFEESKRFIIISTFINADENDKPADKKENIHPNRATETGKRCREMNKYYKQGSNAPKVLDGFEAAFQLIGFRNIRSARKYFP